MSKIVNEKVFLPNEILEKIFIYLPFQTVFQLNQNWKVFCEHNYHYFKEVNIDLLTIKSDFLKKMNPTKIHITCSQFYEKLSNEKIYIISSLKYKLNIIKKYSSLKTVNVKLDLVYIIDDISIIKKDLVQYKSTNINLSNNTICAFILVNLLKIKAENFYITINSDMHKKNSLTDLICYISSLKSLLIIKAKYFDTFIFDGIFDMYFIFDKKIKTFIYRAASTNYSEVGNVTNYIDAYNLARYKLDNLIIYNNDIDSRFSMAIDYDKILNMEYHYFINNNSVYTSLFEQINKLVIKKNTISKHNYELKEMIITEYKKDKSMIRPYDLFIHKNDIGFELKNIFLTYKKY